MLDEQKDDEESASRLPSAPEFVSLYDTREFEEYLVPDAAPVLPVLSGSGTARTSSVMLPQRPAFSRRASALSKKGVGRKNMLLAALALLLVASVGGGFLFYVSHLRPRTVAIQHASLPTSPQALFKEVTGRKPVLYDLLTNSSTSSWPASSTQNGDGQCTFEADGYHVTDTRQQSFYYCMSTGSYYANFAFQAQVSIVSGGGASLVFRGSEEQNKFYRFRIDQYGDYSLLLSNDPTRHAQPQALREGSSQDIHQGMGQMNILTVIATGSDIYLYVNSHFITYERDSTLNVGEIGLSASDFSQSAEAVFSRAEVWRL